MSTPSIPQNEKLPYDIEEELPVDIGGIFGNIFGGYVTKKMVDNRISTPINAKRILISICAICACRRRHSHSFCAWNYDNAYALDPCPLLHLRDYRKRVGACRGHRSACFGGFGWLDPKLRRIFWRRFLTGCGPLLLVLS